jgi:hypothetical protein
MFSVVFSRVYDTNCVCCSRFNSVESLKFTCLARDIQSSVRHEYSARSKRIEQVLVA